MKNYRPRRDKVYELAGWYSTRYVIYGGETSRKPCGKSGKMRGTITLELSTGQKGESAVIGGWKILSKNPVNGIYSILQMRSTGIEYKFKKCIARLLSRMCEWNVTGICIEIHIDIGKKQLLLNMSGRWGSKRNDYFNRAKFFTNSTPTHYHCNYAMNPTSKQWVFRVSNSIRFMY